MSIDSILRAIIKKGVYKEVKKHNLVHKIELSYSDYRSEFEVSCRTCNVTIYTFSYMRSFDDFREKLDEINAKIDTHADTMELLVLKILKEKGWQVKDEVSKAKWSEARCLNS